MDDGLTSWLMSDVPSWMAQAACAGRDQGQWFPDKGAGYAGAQAVCDGCEVRPECLAYALAVEGDVGPKDRHGLWGGATPAERAQLATPRR